MPNEDVNEILSDDLALEDPLEEEDAGVGDDDAARGETRRITAASAVLMLGTALFYDGIETVLSLILYASIYLAPLEPGIAFLISGLFSLTFYIWFTIKGVRFMTWRRILPQLAALVIELVPVLDLLPSRVFSILIIIFLTRLEDRMHMRITPKLFN